MDDRSYLMPKTNTQLKNNNIKRVFFEIQSSAPIQRRELQQRTGLSWGNISLNIASLIDMGLVIETTDDSTIIGRKPQILDINMNDHFLIGIDIQYSAMRAVIVDLKGRIIHKQFHALSYTDKDSVLQEICDLTEQLMTEVTGKHIVAVGIAVQGIVDVDNATSVVFPGLFKWKNVNLKLVIEERFNVKTFIFHDPDAIMFNEKLLKNAKDPSLKNVALIRLEDGVGLSIMINREIFTSITGKSGELGHINVTRDGLLCSCGDRGCLEAYVTSKGIKRRFIQEKDGETPTNVRFSDDSEITIHTLATAAKNKDPLCCKLFREMGDYLGIGISSYINVFNPQLVIIQGEFTKYREIFEKDMLSSIDRHVWGGNETEVVFAEYDSFIAAVGAALAGLEKTIMISDDFKVLFS